MAKYVDHYAHRFTTEGAERAAAAFDQQGAAAGRNATRLRQYGELAEALSGRLEAAGTRGLGAVQSWLAVAGEMEQARVSFTTLLSDEKQAEAFVARLQEFAARTPFEFRGLQRQAKNLLAVGFSAEEIIPLLTDLGDAAGALGAGSAGIDRLVLAFGQMRAMGRPMGDDLRQIAQLGIPAQKILREAFSIPSGKDIASAGLTAEQAIKALRDYMRQKFGGGMAEQSKTLAGSLSNLADNLDLARNALGEPLVNSINASTAALTGMIGALKASSPATRATIAWTTLLGSSLLKAGGWALSAWRDYKQYTGILRIAENTKRSLTLATVRDTAAERTKAGVARTEAGAISQVERAAVKCTRAKNSMAGAGLAGMGGKAMGFQGLMGGGILGGAAAAGGGLLVGSVGAGLMSRTGAEGWGAAGLGAGTAAVGAAQGYALAGPMGAVVGSLVATSTALYSFAAETNRLTRDWEKRTGLKRITEEEAAKPVTRTEIAASFAAMTPEQRAHRAQQLAAKSRTTAGGNVQATVTMTIPGSQVITQQALSAHAALR